MHGTAGGESYELAADRNAKVLTFDNSHTF
jgi:hypothetical protein